MVYQMPQYWDIAIDGIQIILCLLILVFLIRNRRNNRDSLLEEAIGEPGQSFNLQILTQTLKQQVDQAFANIADTIAVEQHKLDKVMPISGHGNQAHGIAHYQSRQHRPTAQEISPIARVASGSDQLHEQIQTLAVKGMPARQISEKLKTPLGEVELVLSLHASVGD